jgi:organic hydroperoxide reductase OsmC/OhrA
VDILPNDDGGWVPAVHLEGVIPELDHDKAQALTAAAHEICPYSNATRSNIDVTITVSDD